MPNTVVVIALLKGHCEFFLTLPEATAHQTMVSGSKDLRCDAFSSLRCGNPHLPLVTSHPISTLSQRFPGVGQVGLMSFLGATELFYPGQTSCIMYKQA